MFSFLKSIYFEELSRLHNTCLGRLDCPAGIRCSAGSLKSYTTAELHPAAACCLSVAEGNKRSFTVQQLKNAGRIYPDGSGDLPPLQIEVALRYTSTNEELLEYSLKANWIM